MNAAKDPLYVRVIIAGGREFQNYTILKSVCSKLLAGLKNPCVEIVSGGCRGADLFGEKFADEFGHDVVIMKPNWKRNGNYGGPSRNGKMAKYADVLIAFWDTRSTGTLDMIKQANDHKLTVRVFDYIGNKIDYLKYL